MSTHPIRQLVEPKLKTLLWFAQRPPMYREALRRIVGLRLTSAASVQRAAAEKEEGRQWCQANLSSVDEFLAHLSLPKLVPVRTLHPEIFAQAERDVARLEMGGPGHIDLLHHLVRHQRISKVIETGVAAGWSSLAVLLALRDRPGARLVSIDMPYPKRNNEGDVGAAVPYKLRRPWTLLRRPDRDALPGALESLGQIDLAHYDSDKSPSGRAFAYPLLWERLRPGGVLLSDDVEDNLAFRDFAESVGRRAWVFAKDPGNYAGAIVK